MTIGAVPLLDRIVFDRGLFMPRYGIRMALSADLRDFPVQKALLERTMGGMAAQASFPAHQGPVQTVFSERFSYHLIVAAAA